MLTSLWPSSLILMLRIIVAIRPLARGNRMTAVFVAGNLLLTLAASLLNPFMCIYVFSSYLDIQRLITGPFLVPATMATGLVTAVGQAGGIPGASMTPWLPPLLAMVNIGVAALMLALSREHERQVQIREETAERLAKANEANLALHEELMAQAHQMGREQERARLSREIHDTVAQGLIGVIRQLEAIPETLNGNARERIQRAEQVARECLLEARRAVQALAPHQLDSTPLAEALHAIIRVRIVQESLANVARHGKASRVWVRLDATAEGPRIRITDDGIGFDPAPAAGHGIPGMRDRITEAGGDFSIDSTPGRGCTVTAVVPA